MISMLVLVAVLDLASLQAMAEVTGLKGPRESVTEHEG